MTPSKRTTLIREAIRHLKAACSDEEQRITDPEASRLEGLFEATKLLERVTLKASMKLDREQYMRNPGSVPASPKSLAAQAARIREQLESQRKKVR